MLSIVPAVVGVPGGIELVVIFFVMFLLFGVPVALALILGYRYVKGQAGEEEKEERIAELEAELADLRDTVEENSTTGPTTDSTSTRSPTDSTGTGSPSDSTNTTPSGHSADSPVDPATNQGVNDDE